MGQRYSEKKNKIMIAKLMYKGKQRLLLKF